MALFNLFGKKKDAAYYFNEYLKANREHREAEARENLKKAAELGDSYGGRLLGRAYLYGDLGLAQSYDKAIEWLSKAASEGRPDLDDDLIFAWEKSGRAGNPPAQQPASPRQEKDEDHYYYQTSLKCRAEGNRQEADYYLVRAAKDGCIHARLDLAQMYSAKDENGVYCEGADLDKAIEWQRRAINIGAKNAYFRLGELYTERGQDESAFDAFRRAAEQGEAGAKWRLARSYDRGIGVARDEKKALSLYQEAADLGDAASMVSLGHFYEKGCGGLEKDGKKAVEWYQKAADAGNPDGYCGIAGCLWAGEVVPRDRDKAVSLYKLAAKQGYAFAAFTLGRVYEATDADTSIGWYQEAAALGMKEGQERADDMILEKIAAVDEFKDYLDDAEEKALKRMAKAGRTKAAACLWKYYSAGDFTYYALEWCWEAVKLGDSEAASALEDLKGKLLDKACAKLDADMEKYRNSGDSSDLFYTNSRIEFELLAKMDNALACYNLGLISQNQNQAVDALRWYEKALECPDRWKYANDDGRSLEELARKDCEYIRDYLKS